MSRELGLLGLPGGEEHRAARECAAVVEHDAGEHSVMRLDPKDPLLADDDAGSFEARESGGVDLRGAVAAEHEIAAPRREFQGKTHPARAAPDSPKATPAVNASSVKVPLPLFL